jgi:phage tail sheath gpL-like
MAVTHSVPSALLVPGVYVEFNIAAASRGLTPISRRVALVGTKTAAGEQDELVPVQAFSDADADRLFGVGSPLALMCKFGFRGARDYGGGAELHAVAIDDPGDTAAEHTLTITGDADEGGEIVVEIAGREVRTTVEPGDDPTAQATKLDAAIDALKAELPVTSASALGVVTTTATVTGVNGSDLVITVVETPAGVSIAVAESVPGVGVTDITAALDALATDDYDWIAIENHQAADVADLAAHLAETWASGVKRWRFTRMAETGDLSTFTALCEAADDFKQCFTWSEDNPLMPGEIAAYRAMIDAAREPTLTTTLNGLALPSIPLPPKASWPQPGLAGEQQAAMSSGGEVLAPDERGVMRLVRAVTSKTTHDGVAYKAMVDTLIGEGMVYTARQCEIAWAAFSDAKKSARVRRQIRSVTYGVLKRLEGLEVLQNVDEHKGQLTVEPDGVDVNAAVAAIPTSVIPGLAKLIGVFNLLVE